MTLIHSKNTFVSVGGTDLSSFTRESDFPRSADSHDTTVYGLDSKRYQSGLIDGTFTMSGFFDNAASGTPRLIIAPLLGGAETAVIRQPEGAGSGLAQDSFNAIVTAYEESSPVDDMCTWSADFQISGDVDQTDQT